jgi:hypothetical protein
MSPAAKQYAWLMQLKEEGKLKSSKTLDAMPKLFADVRWVLAGFEFLNRRRGYGFSGPMPVTVEAMEAYLRLEGIQREDDVEFFVTVVPQLDDIWLEDYGKRAEQKQAREKRPTAHNRR